MSSRAYKLIEVKHALISSFNVSSNYNFLLSIITMYDSYGFITIDIAKTREALKNNSYSNSEEHDILETILADVDDECETIDYYCA